ncbi:hypothetical protein [Actinomadura miaoliensis]|uniref:Integral membrane protein n=1 Tax=Actinomadura miaoliensis TaxID=430685 RepID=A0ABP7WCI1_9ACTN
MLALVLLFGFLAGMITALVVVVCGVVMAVRHWRRSPAGRLRAAAFLAVGVAIGVYAWGMAYTGMAVLEAEDGGTDSSPLRPCRGEADPATVARVIDYRVGLVPLRFECHLAGGGSYTTSSVPGYVNPVAWMLGAAGLIGFMVSAASSKRPSRTSNDEAGVVL